MKKLFTLIALIIVTAGSTTAETRSFKTYEPHIPPYNAFNNYPPHHQYNKHFNQQILPSDYDNLTARQKRQLRKNMRNKVNYRNNIHSNINNSSLSKIEKKMFNEMYNYETTPERIARLEHQMFGAAQSGDLNSRYKRLQSAMNNQNYYYSQPQTNGFWSNIANIFSGGQMTGFTAPLDPNDYGYQNSFNDDKGNYYNNFFDRQTGTGITIID